MDIKLELIFFSGILFGQIIGILLGPKIYQIVKSKIESYRNRKTTQQTQIIVDPFYVETATGKYFFQKRPNKEVWTQRFISSNSRRNF